MWMKNGLRVQAYAVDEFMHFVSARQTNTGIYKCIGSYPNGTKFVESAEVYVGGKVCPALRYCCVYVCVDQVNDSTNLMVKNI